MEIEIEQMTVRDLLALKKNGMLTANSEYQRGAVWNQTQQKKLIDSVMRSYPLPLFYLHDIVVIAAGRRREGFEVIDGQQRINALEAFREGALRLFDPKEDAEKARYPAFIATTECPWAKQRFQELTEELKTRFLNTQVSVAKIKTDVADEARDLFIRLQAGLPLNSQEKRDAWPGNFTDLVLKLGGKPEIPRYPGHEFFTNLVHGAGNRGELRQLCAQICMLFLEGAAKGHWQDIKSQAIDDYYYKNLGKDIEGDDVVRLRQVLDLAVHLLNGLNGPRLKGHEAIHLVLLLDTLKDGYTYVWRQHFVSTFERFRLNLAEATKAKAGELWEEYGIWTRTDAAQAKTLHRRHALFLKEMFRELQPVAHDPTRAYGEVERQILYYRHEKKCAVCDEVIRWDDLEIHHVTAHRNGGGTILENGVPVHKDHHPKGAQRESDFERVWIAKQQAQLDPRQAAQQIRNGRASLPTDLPPDGTRCRYTYKGSSCEGVIANGQIQIDGRPEIYRSVGGPLRVLTDTSLNGWLHCEFLLPDSDDWVLANEWRHADLADRL